jgi:hypothetical protein
VPASEGDDSPGPAAAPPLLPVAVRGWLLGDTEPPELLAAAACCCCGCRCSDATLGCSCRVLPGAAAAVATAATAADTPTTAGSDGTLLLLGAASAVAAPHCCCCCAAASNGPVRDCRSCLLASAGAAPVTVLLLPPTAPSPVPAFPAAADAASKERGDNPDTAAAERGLVGSCRKVPAARRLPMGSDGGTKGCSGPFSCCTWGYMLQHSTPQHAWFHGWYRRTCDKWDWLRMCSSHPWGL